MDSFIELSGEDFVQHAIEQFWASCIGGLWDQRRSNEFTRQVFSGANMVTVTDAIMRRAADYDPDSQDQAYEIKALFEFIVSANHNEINHWPDEWRWTAAIEAKIDKAIDAVAASRDFLTNLSSGHGYMVYSMMRAAGHARYQLDHVWIAGDFFMAGSKDVADRFAHVEWVLAFTELLNLHLRSTSEHRYRSVLTDNPDIAEGLGKLAMSDHLVEERPYFAADTTREFVRLLEQGKTSARGVLEKHVFNQVGDVLDKYDPYGYGVDSYIAAAWMVDYYGYCKRYDTCDVVSEVKANVLTVDEVCGDLPWVTIRAQSSMTTNRLWRTCRALDKIDRRFHKRMETGRTPVERDLNDSVEIVVFTDRTNYWRYAGWFYEIDVGNGGIYVEGDPSDPTNTARIAGYLAHWLDPVEMLNVRHEYTHYLDGRYNHKGGYWASDPLEGGIVWWKEGIADYIEAPVNNPDAFELARGERRGLDYIFSITYMYASEAYDWSYLAFRFLYEEHPDGVSQMLTNFRKGRFDRHRRYLDSQLAKGTYDGWDAWLDELTAEDD